MKNLPTTEERIWSALAHLSAIAFGMGILLPVIGWSEQRRKSKYAAFQCLQALGYQSLGYTVWLLTYLVLIIVLVAILSISLGFMAEGTNVSGSIVGIWTGIFFFVIFGTLGVYFLLPVIAAVACALGRDFRYPIMGNRLARYLGFETLESGDESTWLIEDHEDRWVTAMGHFSVIITMWGMIAPLTAWILQGKRSLFLKFQSIQTLVYQAGVTVLFFGAGMIYMFGFFMFIIMTGFGRNMSAFDSSMGIVGVVFLFGSMLIAVAIFLLLPLFHILGQWAGYRVLKGDDYHYPLLGNIVEKWQHSAGAQTQPELLSTPENLK